MKLRTMKLMEMSKKKREMVMEMTSNDRLHQVSRMVVESKLKKKLLSTKLNFEERHQMLKVVLRMQMTHV